MKLDDAKKNSPQPLGDKAEECDMQASAALKMREVRAITESHEGLPVEPDHDVKKFNIPLPTFIEIV